MSGSGSRHCGQEQKRTGVRAAWLAAATVALLLPASPAAAVPNTYIEMSDGVLLAANVQVPGAGTWPTLLVIDGYEGGTTPNPYYGGPDYATVHVSVRGTGCSGGQFNLFDRRHAMDGYEVVEWIATQPWSDGDVGIWGHSYSGLTGFLVATTDPPHLRAVSVSGLIDDFYRGIAYQGGIQNTGFPVAWLAFARPQADIGGGTLPAISTGDQTCAHNVAARQPNDPAVDPLAAFYTQQTDGTFWQYRNLLTYVKDIKVPIHIVQAYQDEQTGPRGGPHLFEKLKPDPVLVPESSGSDEDDKPGRGQGPPTDVPRGGPNQPLPTSREVVPKRLILTNGDHATAGWAPPAFEDRMRWMDRWVRGIENGIETEPRVVVYFEMQGGTAFGTYGSVLRSDAFPLPETQWRRYYLRSGNLLSPEPPEEEATGSYLTGSPRQSNFFGSTIGSELTQRSGPDEVVYGTAPFSEAAALAGPATATLHVSSTAPDTDLWVEIADVGPDGAVMPLQRGLLRASHRALDAFRSDRTPDGDIYRPYHPHTNPQPVTPGQVYEYAVEIFPFGHIFRPGHSLQISVRTPPLVDNIYAYTPVRAAGVNTIYHDPQRASSLLLPLVPVPEELGHELTCGQQVGIRCIPPQ